MRVSLIVYVRVSMKPVLSWSRGCLILGSLAERLYLCSNYIEYSACEDWNPCQNANPHETGNSVPFRFLQCDD